MSHVLGIILHYETRKCMFMHNVEGSFELCNLHKGGRKRQNCHKWYQAREAWW